MSDAAPEPSIAQLSAKLDELTLGIKLALGLLIVLFSIPNICIAQAIAGFGEIFRDALTGSPLPTTTFILLSHRTLFQVLTFVWPVLGVLTIRYGRRTRSWALGGVLLLLIIGMQFWLTQTALFSPMIGLITGMSETSQN